MDNSRVFLSKFLDQEIYLIREENSLVQENESPSSIHQFPDVAEEESIQYLGSNSKGVILILDEDLSVTDNEFLDKILASVNLSRQEVALIKYNDSLESSISKISDIKSTKIISFGITSGKSRLLDIQTRYSPTSIEGRTVVIADMLSEISRDTDLKRMLWNCLKEIF